MSRPRRFDGRVCLVTGATGIAEAAAKALAGEGARVFIASRTAEHARALAEAVGGGWAQADLSDEAQVQAAVAECVERFERLDCVYNVAGISGRRFGDGPLHDVSLDGWRTVLDNNATSTFLVCRAAVRLMLAQEPSNGQRGAILNMSSVLARHPSVPHFVTHAYAASKGAIESFSRSVAAYYAAQRIRVNVIAPSLVATPMSHRAQSDDAILAYIRDKQPLVGAPLAVTDLVGTALYLLSDEARMVTGQVIDVDAGWGVSGA